MCVSVHNWPIPWTTQLAWTACFSPIRSGNWRTWIWRHQTRLRRTRRTRRKRWKGWKGWKGWRRGGSQIQQPRLQRHTLWGHFRKRHLLSKYIITLNYWKGEVGKTICVYCPKGCAAGIQMVIGTQIFYKTSSVCKAGIHDGKIKDKEGGRIILWKVNLLWLWLIPSNISKVQMKMTSTLKNYKSSILPSLTPSKWPSKHST